MVDFTLTDEQKSMRELAHDFAEKEIRPVAWEYDRDGTWPQEIIDKAWELGLMNNHLPTEYGGPGLGYLDGAIIEEEIAWGCSGIGTSLSCNGLATAPILLAASEELKKEYLGAPQRGAAARLVLSHRARRGLGRLRDEDHGDPQGRQVGHQRLEVLHHQR
jgi:acyl-CoA dehydrogenase